MKISISHYPYTYMGIDMLMVNAETSVPMSQIDDFNRLFPYEEKRNQQYKRFIKDVKDKVIKEIDSYRESNDRVFDNFIPFENSLEWDEKLDLNGLHITAAWSFAEREEPIEEEEIMEHEDYISQVVYVEAKEDKGSSYDNGEYIVLEQSPNAIHCLSTKGGYGSHNTKTFYFKEYDVISNELARDFVERFIEELESFTTEKPGSWVESVYSEAKANLDKLRRVLERYALTQDYSTCGVECPVTEEEHAYNVDGIHVEIGEYEITVRAKRSVFMDEMFASDGKITSFSLHRRPEEFKDKGCKIPDGY